MAPHLYSFFESSSEDDTFHIQCEWFNKGKLDLENENLDQDNNSTVYCLVTVTDLKDYYTRASKVYLTDIYMYICVYIYMYV